MTTPQVRCNGKGAASCGRRAVLRLPTRSPLAALCFVLPALLAVMIFQYGPILAAILSSMKEYSPAGRSLGFVGLQNFVDLLQSGVFWKSFWLTLGFILLKVVLQMSIGLGTAMLLAANTRFNRLVRFFVFLPSVISIVVVGHIFVYMFDRETGVLNAISAAISGYKINWFTDPLPTQIMMVILSLWRDAGIVMLVLIAGLQAIPAQLFEAARIDGSSQRQLFFHMTLPLLARSIQFCAVFSTLNAMGIVPPIVSMTKGGPFEATNLLGYMVYEEAFSYFDWGRTSALSLVILVLMLSLLAIEHWLLKPRWQS